MADNNKIIIEVGVTGDAEQQIKRLTVSVEDFGNKGQSAFSKFNGAFDVFAGTLTSNALIGGIKGLTSAAASLFETLVSDGIKAAIAQEDALNKLNTALVITGKYSAEASAELEEFASFMQQTTKFEDDAVLSASALIQSLGNLSKDGLKNATKAAADLSAALGIDLQSAAQLVGKAAAGEVGTLGRYGIALEKGADKAETFARALEAINSKFGGSAAAQVNTFSGSITQLENIIGDVKEEIGFLVINNQSLINVMKTLGQIFNDVGQYIKSNRASVNDLVSNGLISLIEALSFVVVGIETTTIAILKMESAALTAKLGLRGFQYGLTGFEDIGKDVEETANKIEKLDSTVLHLEKGNTIFTKMQDGIERLKKAAIDGLGQMTNSTQRYTNANQAAAGSVQELTEAQKKLIEEGVKLADQAAKKDPAVEFKQRSEALAAAREADKITEYDYAQAVVAYQQERFDKISALHLQEAELIIAKNQELTTSDLYANNEQIIANQARLQQILASESLSAKDRQKIQTAYAQQSKVIEQERANAISASLNALASLQTAKTKELAAVGKAAAIAQATIDTYKGATSAASALAGIPFVGPALAAAAAAAFIAAGLARVASIAGTPLATGITEVPPGYSNDTFPARLTSGERVVDAGTNQDLKVFLANSSGMVPILMGILQRLNALETRVNVYVGGRLLVEEVRTGIEQGRTLDVSV